MVNNNTKPSGVKPAGSPPVLAGGSVPTAPVGNGSNPAGNGGSGGSAAASPSQVIPGAALKAKTGPRTEITEIVQGLGTKFPDGSITLLVKGQPTPVSSLIASLTAVLSLFASVDDSRQQLKQSLQALQAALPDARSLTAAIRVALVALFGKGNPVLESFGINAKPRQKLTTEQLAARKAKAAATRALRGTTGKRQKADVKFQGTVQVQANLSGPQAAGGNATPTGTDPANGGAPTGAAQSGASKP